MTTIAYDGRFMAADTMCLSGFTKASTRKVWRLRDGVVAGAAGDAAIAHEVIDWIARGANPATFPAAQRGEDWSLVLVVANGCIMRIERSPIPIVVDGPFAAVGSGAEIALAAMALGKSAYQAVEIACTLDKGTGGKIDCIDVGGDVFRWGDVLTKGDWVGDLLQRAMA